MRLVLPSPNGSTLSLATGATPTLAGCLRNSRAVAARAARIGRRIAVIPCGERWPGDSLRPAVEDQLGAGAIISHLAGSKSPEAHAAQALFESCRTDLARIVAQCASGQELIRRGFRADIEHAARLDCSDSRTPAAGRVLRRRKRHDPSPSPGYVNSPLLLFVPPGRSVEQLRQLTGRQDRRALHLLQVQQVTPISGDQVVGFAGNRSGKHEIVVGVIDKIDLPTAACSCLQADPRPLQWCSGKRMPTAPLEYSARGMT